MQGSPVMKLSERIKLLLRFLQKKPMSMSVSIDVTPKRRKPEKPKSSSFPRWDRDKWPGE